MPLARVLLGGLLLLLALIYVRHYASCAPDVTMLQASIANSRLQDLLLERNPLIINEPVAELQDFLSTVMRYLFVSARRVKKLAAGSWVRVYGRFAVLHNAAADTFIDLRHPKQPGNLVSLRLPRNQIAVLPPQWSFRIVDKDNNTGQERSSSSVLPTVQLVNLYDTLHLVLRPFAGLLWRRSSL